LALEEWFYSYSYNSYNSYKNISGTTGPHMTVFTEHPLTLRVLINITFTITVDSYTVVE